jgi:hypothetical protein
MKSSIFTYLGAHLATRISISWDITSCSLLKVNWRYGGKSHLHFQGGKIGQTRNEHEPLFKIIPNVIFWPIVSSITFSTTAEVSHRVVRRRASHISQTVGSQMVVMLTALRAGRPFTPPPPHEDSWYSFLLEAESKNPMTSPGIEPATFRLVA